MQENPPQARSQLKWLGVVVVALAIQLLVTGGLGSWAADSFSKYARDLDVPSLSPSVNFEVAKSEREINAQQQHSAALFQQLAGEKPLGDVDVEAPQPDEVREAAVAATWHELKCGQKIPPESAVVTRGVEIFVKSTYRGGGAAGHSWSYVVAFRNLGVDTVQMLTRHWVFTDAMGKVSEMKGPGARGVTPILRPGDSWQYESGSRLDTRSGAMHGSFQLETLRSVSGEMPSTFSARVGRLALSPIDGLELVPCGEAATDRLPDTSVRATRRVIVGASVEPVPQMSDPAANVFRWAYDVQINNARDLDLTVVAHYWVTVADGEEIVQEQGAGVGGHFKSHTHQLLAGDAFRTKGLLTTATPTAIALGAYKVKAQTSGGDDVEIEAEIGAIGLSIHGEPVADLVPREIKPHFPK